ncbi:hypothetical protein RUM44_013717 [Polyplax serrata]|uniref:Sex-determining region Y protein n=1 Tax=Polyplax serrata TaxID=468196 RepID=A0ABR1BIW1_POLSC
MEWPRNERRKKFSRRNGIGLYISDTFDQNSFETVDFTEEEEEYNTYKNVQSHLVRTRMVPVHDFRASKPTAVLSDGFNSIQIISNDDNIGHDLLQSNSIPDGTQQSVYLMNDNVKMLARRKCMLQPERRQKAENNEYHTVIVHEPEAKIPRPPNAFMIFANEWRKKVAHKFNNESNKDISVRLGQMWRSLDKSRKEEYFVMARKADAEHKMKYPGGSFPILSEGLLG